MRRALVWAVVALLVFMLAATLLLDPAAGGRFSAVSERE
jgi:hypothetical protein